MQCCTLGDSGWCCTLSETWERISSKDVPKIVVLELLTDFWGPPNNLPKLYSKNLHGFQVLQVLMV